LPLAAGTLAPGAEGRSVTALQSALASKGFDPGGIDGEYGPLTSAAVSNFQRANSMPVTGVADPATLQKLGVSADGSGGPSNLGTLEAGMQSQGILNALIDALARKQSGTPATPAQAADSADITQLMQTAIAALAGKPLPVQPGDAGSAVTTPPVLSTIDQIFGGQALAGKKTLLAVIAYVIVAILQATGVMGTATGDDATAAGQILTTVIGAFGVLGGAAKVDRMTQALSMLAGATASAQK
jgi:peptidoglycan hydrolase-like protein with peptidoglycan-binding domain